MKLFNRKLVLQVVPGDGSLQALPIGLVALDFSELDCEFHCRKTLKPEPNTLTVRIYNLNKEHQKALQDVGSNIVRLEAGYEGGSGLLFQGEVRSAYTVKEGENWVTTLETGDSEKEIAVSGIKTSFGPSASLSELLKPLVTSMGVKPGNYDVFVAKHPELRKAAFAKRGVLTGNSAAQLSAACNAAGVEWSIQDGEMQFLKKGYALEDSGFNVATVLSPQTGLIGSPAIEAKGKPGKNAHLLKVKQLGQHLVTATSLINPDIRCGRLVKFESEHVTGTYRVIEIETVGNRKGKEWYHNIKCSPYPPPPDDPQPS